MNRTEDMTEVIITPEGRAAVCAELDNQIAALEERKAKLLALAKLREEVAALESGQITGTANQAILRVIVEEVCHQFKLSLGALLSRNRTAAVSIPRFVVFQIARELNKIPYEQIGSLFKRDHGTIISGCHRLRDLVATEAALAAKVYAIKVACHRRLADSLDNY